MAALDVFSPAPTSHASLALCRAALLLARSPSFQALLARVTGDTVDETYALARIFFDFADPEAAGDAPFIVISDTESATLTSAAQGVVYEGTLYALLEVPVSEADTEDPTNRTAALRFRNDLGAIMRDCVSPALIGQNEALYPRLVNLVSPPQRADPSIWATQGDFYQARFALSVGGT